MINMEKNKINKSIEEGNKEWTEYRLGELGFIIYAL